MLVHTYTHRGIFNRLVLSAYTHAHTHKEEYPTDYIRIFVMFPFSTYFLIYEFDFYKNFFVLNVLLCASFHIMHFICLFKYKTTIICGGTWLPNQIYHHQMWNQKYTPNNHTTTPSFPHIVPWFNIKCLEGVMLPWIERVAAGKQYIWL